MTINDLYDLASAEHITVTAFDLHSREALSFMEPDGSCHIAIDPFALASPADELTKLAHELGHCVTGSFYNIYSDCDNRRQHERRADKWAIKKLVPEDELRYAIYGGLTEPWELAELFGVSEDMIRRAAELYGSNGV